MKQLTMQYINIECNTHRYITKENPIIFEFNSIFYIGYRENGFVKILIK